MACQTLRIQWEMAGHTTAEFRVVVVARRAGTPIYGVRSNLVNGMPPAAPEEAPWP
ncbi:MAG: hypothetical protein MI785_14970 [Kiloniellales bacterium]|nr:hypothetical protein [Kiloniellales bacterium]